MNKSKLIKTALVNSLATVIYISLVVFVMMNGQNFFGTASDFGGGLAMLMLFVLSAAVTGSLVIGKSILLYLDGAKKEAIKLLLYTILDLSLITLIIMIILGLTK